MAMAFEDLQSPPGNRVAIVTNAGGRESSLPTHVSRPDWT